MNFHSVEATQRIVMELFHSNREFWQTMGIKPPHPNQIHPFNARNLFFILSLIMVCISTLAFLVFRAEVMLEYGICVYGSLSDLTLLADILISIWQIPNIFKMIEMCEQFIEMSEYRNSWPFITIKSSYLNSHLIHGIRNRIEKCTRFESNVR